MALNLIMLGPPGAGKGTQAEEIARSRGIPKISTGDILREAVQAGTEMGRRVKAVMDRGDLVGDDLIVGIVRERLDRSDARAGFVLDGFPRTVAQAAVLDAIMEGRDPLVVINLTVPEAELARRLSVRLVCEGCGATANVASGGSAASANRAVPAGSGAGGNTARDEAMRCRRCGGRLTQRSDDSETVVLERLKVYRRDTEPLIDYYRARQTYRSIDGAQSPEVVAAALATAVEAVGSGLNGGAGR